MKKLRNNTAGQLLLFSPPDEEERAGEDASWLRNGQVVGAGPQDLSDGRDELNLAEFPLCLLTDRASSRMQELTFEDEIYDQGDGAPVKRCLTIRSASGVGLPNAGDGDVLLAMIQLTRWANGFSERTITFSRYELIKMLRWPDTGWHYARLEESLNRWVGVTLYYDRAWWDKKQQTWVDEKFHVLDRVSMRENGTSRSSVTWNEVVFRSFQSENLKRLDVGFYFDLKFPTSRRLFRFLDKRFYRRTTCSFDLRILACEHVGLSRTSTAAQIKRSLLPAIRELEERGFLAAIGDSERFISSARGRWRVVFVRKQSEAKVESEDLVKRMTDIGVIAPVAANLATEYPSALIRLRLEVVAWLGDNKDRRVDNLAGYFVESLRQGWSTPPKFQSAADREAKAARKRAAAEAEQRAAGAAESAKRAAEAERAAAMAPVLAYIEAMPEAQRSEMEADIFKTSPPEERAGFKVGGSCYNHWMNGKVRDRVKRILSGGDDAWQQHRAATSEDGVSQASVGAGGVEEAR